MTIRFGTDGWRAVISDTFTFANLRLVAQAIADYVLEETTDSGVQPEVPLRPLRHRGGPCHGWQRDHRLAVPR